MTMSTTSGDRRGRWSRPSLLDRFLTRVPARPADECWGWTGAVLPNGRAVIYVAGYSTGNGQRPGNQCMAARVSHELFIGPIPPGHVVDHVQAQGCQGGVCTNPRHLEAVTQYENTVRGNSPTMAASLRGECLAGHPMDDVYVKANGDRQCARCQRERGVARYRTSKVLANA